MAKNAEKTGATMRVREDDDFERRAMGLMDLEKGALKGGKVYMKNRMYIGGWSVIWKILSQRREEGEAGIHISVKVGGQLRRGSSRCWCWAGRTLGQHHYESVAGK